MRLKRGENTVNSSLTFASCCYVDGSQRTKKRHRESERDEGRGKEELVDKQALRGKYIAKRT